MLRISLAGVVLVTLLAAEPTHSASADIDLTALQRDPIYNHLVRLPSPIQRTGRVAAKFERDTPTQWNAVRAPPAAAVQLQFLEASSILAIWSQAAPRRGEHLPAQHRIACPLQPGEIDVRARAMCRLSR